ncbi:uncharacterized protein EV422DRAFT_514913 [Fimicolochytrium jonesii]|uniref:uncharacterized protein n=1 Tax=Fimicolochytrium jonesii TaxID=1396493 RepID=UPI0022FE20E5|nr:uncharacterized protein EV422DRAFT_514913 [Fimicolochytrium jonesii]KAI8825977.1 hypothetical protein EV422DRAFT_514913 [Fimicolochytrium jonesii]
MRWTALVFPQPHYFIEPIGPKTTALARLCTSHSMPLPLVSGLSMGLRFRTKFIFGLVTALCLLYFLTGRRSSASFEQALQENVVLEDIAAANGIEEPAAAAVDAKVPPVVAAVLPPPSKTTFPRPSGVDPALVPVVSSFFNGRLPKGITGRALSRVYEWAEKAEMADLAARRAYDEAVDAKAMLYISAATNMKDLISRYWQTHALHYNASIQLRAAERIREFLLDPTFAVTGSGVSPLQPKKTPLCLIATYEGQNDAFPDYATVLVDSVARNAPYADLHLFVHNTTKASFPHDMQRPNVKIIDISHIHPSYSYRGFAGLATDRLCKALGREPPADLALGWEGYDQECDTLERRLRAFEGRGGSVIDQLRGAWGTLFAEQVSSDRCDSWGWIDVGTAVGDLSRWMDNKLIKDADLFTAHEGDAWRLYLRSSFTVHNYRTTQPSPVKKSVTTNPRPTPSDITTLWKHCKSLSSIPALLTTFANPSDWLSLTEGCYSHSAIHAPGISTVLAPWQLPSWADTRLLIVHDGRAHYCVGESNAESCRGWVRGFAREKEELAAAMRNPALGKKTAISKPLAFHTAKEIFSNPSTSSHPVTLLPRKTQKCSEWLPAEYNLCTDKTAVELIDQAVANNQIAVQLVVSDEKSSVIATVETFPRPDDGVANPGVGGTNTNSRGVGEMLLVRFLEWTSKQSKDADAKKDTAAAAVANMGKEAGVKTPKLEKTWFYTVANGSIQISPGKILLHTVGGWWY